MLKTANKLLQKEVDGIWHVAISGVCTCSPRRLTRPVCMSLQYG